MKLKCALLPLLLLVSELSVMTLAVGSNGVIQIVGVGEYCIGYFDALQFTYRLDYATCQNCDGLSVACFGQVAEICPWNYDSGCVGLYIDSHSDYEEYDYTCSAGCISKQGCTAKANAYFTGIGTVGDSNSCPFACNPGYTRSGALCVGAAAPTTTAAITQPLTTPAPTAQAGPNAYFTGVGTIAGDSLSCPFDCSVGYTKSDYSCVMACSNGNYFSNGGCVPCRTCTSGHWLNGCTAANAGDCIVCDNNS